MIPRLPHIYSPESLRDDLPLRGSAGETGYNTGDNTGDKTGDNIEDNTGDNIEYKIGRAHV